jgi:hypothetical protein
MPLRPQLQAVLERANDQRKKADGAVRRLKPNQLTWTPGRGLWTVAQVLDHLNKSVELTAPKFEEALRGAEAAGDERDTTLKYRFIDKVFISMVGPNSPVKIPVPPIFEPEASPNPQKIVRRFFELHDSFAALIQRADGFRLKELRVSSPVTTKLRPGFISYMDGFVAHEAYHLGQIYALIADPDFPK